MLARRIDRRLARTEFQSRDEYVVYALNQLLAQLDSDDSTETTEPNRKEDDGSTEQNRENVEDRLQSLGYL